MPLLYLFLPGLQICIAPTDMKANDVKIAVTAYDAKTLESYQIKGTTEYITEGAIVDTFKKQERTVIHFAFIPIFSILKQRLPPDA